jgi:hypothetical protein
MDEPPTIAGVILELCEKAVPPNMVDPADAAQAFAKATGRLSVPWQGYLDRVRETAVVMAKEGKIAIYRRGELADPDTFKGPYKLGLPKA